MRATLENGLKIIVEPSYAAPVVAAQCWVGVGSADEGPGEEGLAHLHEHMLFKGTARRGPGRIARDVESRGGDVNAWTSFDHTVYHLVIGSRFLGDGLEVLADALSEPLFDAAELESEIEVVLEEIRRAEDAPSRRLSHALFRRAFPGHPYGRPVTGGAGAVRAATPGSLRGFFAKHYAPERMTLVVAGDVEPERAVAAAAETFGRIPRRAAASLPARIAVRRNGPVGTVLREDAQEAFLSIAWPAPALANQDTPALDLAAVLLGQGDASRLPLRVKRERRLATDVYAYAWTPREPGLFVAGAVLPPDRLEGAARAIAFETARLAREQPGEDELAAAKAIIEADRVYQRETVQGLARKLGFYEVVAGGVEEEVRYQERVAGLSGEDVRAAAERWLAQGSPIVAALGPREGEVPGEAELVGAVAEGIADALSRPAPAAPPTPRRPPERIRPGASGRTLAVRRLPGGATLLVQPEPGVPLVAMRAVWRGGVRFETEADHGVTQLLARLLTRGTSRRGASAVAREVDALAGSLSGHAGRNSFGLRGEFLARQIERGFGLFAECLLDPALAADEVERERTAQLEEVRARDDSPGATVFDLFSQALWREHPYRLTGAGTAESLGRLDAAALKDHFARRYPVSRLVLAICGDVDPGYAADAAAQAIAASRPGGEGQAEPRPPREAAPASPREARRAATHQQSHCVIGFRGVAVDDEDRFALDALASALGGQGGRLFVELRERRGLAYSVSAMSVEGLDPGYFAVHLATHPDKLATARDAALEELRRVADEGLPEEDLDRARRWIIGSHAIGLQKTSARAAVLAFDEAYGLGAQAHRRYPERIEALTPSHVRDVARRLIDLDRRVIAVLGPP